MKETRQTKYERQNKSPAKRGVPRVAEDTRVLPQAAHIPLGRGTVPGQQSSTTAASDPPPTQQTASCGTLREKSCIIHRNVVAFFILARTDVSTVFSMYL